MIKLDLALAPGRRRGQGVTHFIPPVAVGRYVLLARQAEDVLLEG